MPRPVLQFLQRSLALLRLPAAAVCLCFLVAGCAAVPERGRIPSEVRGLEADEPGFALYQQGRRQERQGDLAGAIKSYLEAATANPDQPQILEALGLAYLQAGDHRTARMHLERAVGLNPDAYRVRMGLGYVALQRADYGEAIEQLAKSVALQPNIRNRFLLAEALEKNGQLEQAGELYREVAAADRWGKLGRTAVKRLGRLGAAQ